ncbi:hypothetical protein GI582_05340 [Sulfitobacter sp. BDSS02]|uniref:hypothetical protein n=1 Tax=Heliomarina sp. TaxID=2917556 RepID=UPI004059C0B3|nr:hypothetical protein [Sulfitobacter sp. BDSS02]MBR9848470.1 hypothetical protein [Paracoccaceae bacterium]
MNSIALTPLPSPVGETVLHVALSRLGAYLDDESGSLEALLKLAGRSAAADDIRALHALHLDTDATEEDLRQLLMQAQTLVVRLLDTVRAIPLHARFSSAPSDFDAWLRWSGARLQDVCKTLSRALAN